MQELRKEEALEEQGRLKEELRSARGLHEELEGLRKEVADLRLQKEMLEEALEEQGRLKEELRSGRGLEELEGLRKEVAAKESAMLRRLALPPRVSRRPRARNPLPSHLLHRRPAWVGAVRGKGSGLPRRRPPSGAPMPPLATGGSPSTISSSRTAVAHK